MSAGLWDDLRFLLDMLPTADTEGDPRLGMATGQGGPSILAADAAVTALEVGLSTANAVWDRDGVVNMLWSSSQQVGWSSQVQISSAIRVCPG